jgi:hypothetical protein
VADAMLNESLKVSCLYFPFKAMKAPELKEKLEESEKLIKELTVTWEEKLRKTEEIAQVS